MSTPTPSIGHELEDEEEEGGRFSLPSIDVEVNVTINVDYGIIILRTEERCVLQMYLTKCRVSYLFTLSLILGMTG